MDTPLTNNRGSAEWVRARLATLVESDDWRATPECGEIFAWLYTVAAHRARRLSLRGHDLDEVVQDSMLRMVRALSTSTRTYLRAANPAAMLERIAIRAVAESSHNLRMYGYGGAASNGQNMTVMYPVRVGADSAEHAFDQVPAPVLRTGPDTEAVARHVARWVRKNVGVELTAPVVDAVIYVLDRMVSGVSRASLVRSSHGRLRVDPALSYLGLSEASAGGFAVGCLAAPTARTIHPQCSTPPSSMRTRRTRPASNDGDATRSATHSPLPQMPYRNR